MILKCEECETPVAELRQGIVVIEVRHHGERHVTAISVWDLVLMVLKEMSGEAKESNGQHTR